MEDGRVGGWIGEEWGLLEEEGDRREVRERGREGE